MKDKASQFAAFCLVLGASLLFTCDPFQEDLIPKDKQVIFNPNSQTIFYTLPNSSIVIDLSSIVQSTFTIVSLNVSVKPERGKLSLLGDLVWKYDPNPNFLDGHDLFIYSVNATNGLINGTVLASDTVYIMVSQDIAEFPCMLFAVEDFASIKPGTNVSISLLDNDRVCGTDKENLNSSIFSKPLHGTASLTNDIISYTASEGYEGWDQFAYKISTAENDTRASDDSVMTSYGLISILVDDVPCSFEIKDDTVYYRTVYLNPNRPPPSPVEFNFLGNDLFCHFDMTESDVSIVRGPEIGTARQIGNGRIIYESPAVVTNIRENFIDTIIYRICYKGLCKDALMKIVLRSTWSLLQPPASRSFSSAWFSDENTGYIGSSVDMYKTVDGGKHWKQLINSDLLSLNGLSFFEVHDLFFFNADHGWAVGSEGSLETHDGGESWNYYTTSGTSIFFTSPSTGYVSGKTVGALYKTTDGGNSWYATNIQSPASEQPIFDIVFTNANTGYARTQKHIIKTIDGGENWSISFTKDDPVMEVLSLTSVGSKLYMTWTGLIFWGPSDGPYGNYVKGSFVSKSDDGIFWTPTNSITAGNWTYAPRYAWGCSFSPSANLGIAYGGIPMSIMLPKIYIGTDQGSTWQIDEMYNDFSLADRNLKAAAVPSDRIAYVVGDNIILKYESP